MNNKVEKIKNKKSLEYLRELKKVCIKNGNININILVQLWQQVPDKVKVDILPAIMQEFAISKNEFGENIEDVNLVGNLWLCTPKKVQEATIGQVISSLIVDKGNNEKVIELENLNTLLYATKDKNIISKKIGDILKVLDDPQIINSEEAYKEIYNKLPVTTNYSLFNIIRINRKGYPIKLDKRGLELLSNKINKKVPIILEVKNAGELSNIEIQNYLDNGFNIQYIKLKGEEDENNPKSDTEKHVERLPYDLDTYMKCREKIDEIIKKVGFTVNQKELFIKIVKEISKIHYFHKCEQIFLEDDSIILSDFNHGYGYRKLYNSCSNLVGLVKGATICGGYSEIINNIMSCCGIECISVTGDHNLGIRHIWNQVKLDGVWYNADVTYDAENIEKKKQPYWLLRSDKDFLTDVDGKSFYMRHIHSKELNGILHKCSQSVPYDEINMYLNETLGTSSNSDSQNEKTVIIKSKQENDPSMEK